MDLSIWTSVVTASIIQKIGCSRKKGAQHFFRIFCIFPKKNIGLEATKRFGGNKLRQKFSSSRKKIRPKKRNFFLPAIRASLCRCRWFARLETNASLKHNQGAEHCSTAVEDRCSVLGSVVSQWSGNPDTTGIKCCACYTVNSEQMMQSGCNVCTPLMVLWHLCSFI